MNYPQYQDDIKAIYRSEVTGEVMFALLASLSFAEEKKHKWQTLQRLEAQTKAQYLRYLESQGLHFSYPVGAWMLGAVVGLAFCLLPWQTAMKGLASGTPPLIEVFERLHSHASEADKVYFASVVAHEMAIARFAELELQQRDDSLKPVLELLA